MLSPTNIFLIVWFFALGTVVGSFLNVVIYRLPRGQSLVHPGSRCPQCETPIRWYDNVPIVSWLALRGRCRQCGAAISHRYPLVEFSIGLVFLVLGVLEGIGRGVNLPRPETLNIDPWTTGELAIFFTYHVILLCGLIAAAWIVYDHLSLPPRLVSFMLGLGLSVPLLLPFVRPVDFAGRWRLPSSLSLPGDFSTASWATTLADTAAGLVAGIILGLTTTWICRIVRKPIPLSKSSPNASAANDSSNPSFSRRATTSQHTSRKPSRSARRRKRRSSPKTSARRGTSAAQARGIRRVSVPINSPCHGLLSGGLWIGMFLGWQATAAVLALSLTIELPVGLFLRWQKGRSTYSASPPSSPSTENRPHHTWPALGSLALATLVWLIAWRPIWMWIT